MNTEKPRALMIADESLEHADALYKIGWKQSHLLRLALTLKPPAVSVAPYLPPWAADSKRKTPLISDEHWEWIMRLKQQLEAMSPEQVTNSATVSALLAWSVVFLTRLSPDLSLPQSVPLPPLAVDVSSPIVQVI